jgi:hypothetical protein
VYGIEEGGRAQAGVARGALYKMDGVNESHSTPLRIERPIFIPNDAALAL